MPAGPGRRCVMEVPRMKLKQLLSGALGLALALTVSAPAASAASAAFPDIQNHWAKS